MYIRDQYRLVYKEEYLGSYYFFSGGSISYSVTSYLPDEWKKDPALEGLLKDIEQKRPLRSLERLISEDKRVPGLRKAVYTDGDLRLERIAQETGEKFLIYRRSAQKGEEGYSERDRSAPHDEGPKTPEGMKEWASWYCFNKMDDGTFEAELDEAWWWGGGHNDGGTIRTAIPEDWHSLPYDEFLEHVITLAAAAHYGFTADELKEKQGLKSFFGFEQNG